MGNFPADINLSAPYIRDSVNLRRYTNTMLLALLPCTLFGIWNTGYQANHAMMFSGVYFLEGWLGTILEWLELGLDPENNWSNTLIGLFYFLPIFLVSIIVTLFWETLFARLRGYELREGGVLLALIFTLTLPASIPLWQVALGISFGVVFGKEIFGGTGMNIVHPVLAGRTFLYFAYPDHMTGDGIWNTIDSISGATPLTELKQSGLETLLSIDIDWSMAFFGLIPGSLGETSTLACLLGGSLLLMAGFISWRIILGIFFGMIFTSTLFNYFGNNLNTLATTTWYWHAVLGGFAFGSIFLATDPVTSATTNPGRWCYGLLIGILVVIIRVTNPVTPEGIMFAILLANLCAPLIDYGVVQLHIYSRQLQLKHNRVHS
jgi:Na+-transporting NADH:ubiquinone oxidoreductase subunit B